MNMRVILSIATFGAALGVSPNLYAQQYPFYCTGNTDCIYASDSGGGIGLHALTQTAVAVYGASSSGSGIYGKTSDTTGAQYGIEGQADHGLAGVYGLSTSGYGGTFSSYTNAAVQGTSTSWIGGSFLSGGPAGILASTSVSTGNGVVGLEGTASVSFSGSGVYGSSSAGNGVLGAVSNTSAAINGYNTNTGGWAGYFNKNVNIVGGLYFNGSCALPMSSCTSDVRLKKNIESLSGSLATLAALRPVSYEWKEPTDHRPAGKHLGFIAQEVERVKPEWTGVDEQGFKNVNMSDLPVLVVDSIRTLKLQNDELRERVQLLEAGRRPTLSGFGAGWIGGLVAVAGALAVSRRRRPEVRA